MDLTTIANFLASASRIFPWIVSIVILYELIINKSN